MWAGWMLATAYAVSQAGGYDWAPLIAHLDTVNKLQEHNEQLKWIRSRAGLHPAGKCWGHCRCSRHCHKAITGVTSCSRLGSAGSFFAQAIQRCTRHFAWAICRCRYCCIPMHVVAAVIIAVTAHATALPISMSLPPLLTIELHRSCCSRCASRPASTGGGQLAQHCNLPKHGHAVVVTATSEPLLPIQGCLHQMPSTKHSPLQWTPSMQQGWLTAALCLKLQGTPTTSCFARKRCKHYQPCCSSLPNAMRLPAQNQAQR